LLRTSLFTLLLLILGLPVTAYTETIALPDMGDSSSSEVSPIEERKLGENLMRWLRQNDLIETDPVIQSYIHSIGYQLVANSDESSQPFTFFVVKDQSINAFAAPGGFIGIHAGLILTSESESELAGVMAHEVAHITQKHLLRKYESANKHRLTTAVALLAAILIGQNAEELTEAAIATSLAASTQLQINFTRAHEKEADFVGIRTLANAGFDPEGMPKFFARMQKASQLYGQEIPEFLSTHPVTVNRIAESTNRARNINKQVSKQDNRYPIIKARLVVKKEQQINQFLMAYKNSKNQLKDKSIFHYTMAIASLKAGLAQQAKKHIDLLVRNNQENIYYRLTEAEILQALKQTKQADKIYSQLMRIYPYSYPVTIYYADFLLASGQHDSAYEKLQAYAQNRHADTQVLKLLSEAAGKTGRTSEAYLYLAEHEFLKGNTRTAISHLNSASKLKNTDYYLASKIEAKLRQYKQVAILEK